jgi:hypothetical protein
MNFEDIMKRCDEKWERLGLEALSEVEKVIALVACVNYQLSLGSIGYFYASTDADYAIEAIWAFEQIGVMSVADALRTGNDLLSTDGTYPVNAGERRKVLINLNVAQPNILEELSWVCYRSENQVLDSIEDYIETHADDLRATGIL